MSTQTNHLGLHQWEAEDKFLRTDFNEDFGKIDAGVKTVADALATETAARESAVTTEASARQSADSAEASARQSADSALNAALESETAAREAAVAALTARVEGGIVVGEYTMSKGSTVTVTLGFKPRLVLLLGCYSADSGVHYAIGVVTEQQGIQVTYYPGYPRMDSPGVNFTNTGFTVASYNNYFNGDTVSTARYVAFR